jgi:hypothetical protein
MVLVCYIVHDDANRHRNFGTLVQWIVHSDAKWHPDFLKPLNGQSLKFSKFMPNVLAELGIADSQVSFFSDYGF